MRSGRERVLSHSKGGRIDCSKRTNLLGYDETGACRTLLTYANICGRWGEAYRLQVKRSRPARGLYICPQGQYLDWWHGRARSRSSNVLVLHHGDVLEGRQTPLCIPSSCVYSRGWVEEDCQDAGTVTAQASSDVGVGLSIACSAGCGKGKATEEGMRSASARTTTDSSDDRDRIGRAPRCSE